MVPIHKSGELDDPNNFRGISLNSCLSKLFTLLLNKRLTAFCDSEGIIHENQIGFRKGYRTSDHVLTLKTLIDQAFLKKKKLYVCFVDFKKAYDTVWRNGLYLKLLKMGVSTRFVNLIRDMYSRLQVSVNVLNGLSIPFKSSVGLKQGCNLSPLLFNLFINNLVDIIDSGNPNAPHLDKIPVSCLLYADDLILISESEQGLQNSLNKLDEFTEKSFLEVNMKKTKCLVFARGRPRIPNFQWNLNGEKVEMCDSYCYLGVTFTKSGSMIPAAQALYEKAVGAMFSIIRNINKHGACSVDILLEIFDKMVLPIALYNCEVWGVKMLPQDPNKIVNPLYEKQLTKDITENLQFKFLKIILRLSSRTSNWAVLSEFGKYPVTLKIIKLMVKYYLHMTQSPSKIMQAVISTNKIMSNQGYSSYYSYIQRIFKLFNIDHLLYTCDINEIRYQVLKLDNTLRSQYKQIWQIEKNQFQSNSKLELFSSLKDKFAMSDYLKLVKNPQHRSALARIRLSAHKYPIETGRYQNIPRGDRDCPLGCMATGDEEHYILACSHPFIERIRKPIMDRLRILNPVLGSRDINTDFQLLVNNKETNFIRLVGKLCYLIQEKFQEITF
jgi:hypothetical protein